MKKIICILMIMFLLTGCSQETIICVMENETDGVRNYSQVSFVYKNEELDGVNLYIEMNLIDNEEISEDSFAFSSNIVSSFYEDFVNEDMEIKEELTTDNFSLSLSIKKNSVEDIKKILAVDTTDGNAVKKSLESAQYVCK